MCLSADPIPIIGVTPMAAIKQVADTPDFAQGAKEYGQRIGAIGADRFSDILIGGSVLLSLLHQDPRYFYLPWYRYDKVAPSPRRLQSVHLQG